MFLIWHRSPAKYFPAQFLEEENGPWSPFHAPRWLELTNSRVRISLVLASVTLSTLHFNNDHALEGDFVRITMAESDMSLSTALLNALHAVND